MAFKLDAGVLSQTPGKKTGQSWAVYDLKSVGIWEGEELKDSGDGGEGTFIGISTKFAMMTRANPKKKKPITFSWSPTKKEDKTLFNSILRNRSFEFTVVVKDQHDNFWTLNFREVKLIKAPLRNRNIERIEATFIDFEKIG